MTSPAADLDSKLRPMRNSGAGDHDVNCRHCQQSNPYSRRFCSGCGQSLWVQCPACHTECPADEKFCGHCGANIAAELERQQRACDAALTEAAQLAAAHRHDDALITLARIAAESDPRLAPWAAQAREEIGRVEQQRQQQLAQLQDILAAAQQCFVAFEYERAQQALEEIPVQVRSAEHEALLLKARSCRQELVALSGEIRSAVEQKRMGDLLPKLERLLALKPNHAQARQLAQQLAASLVKRAKTHLAQHEYQHAFDHLDQIPSVVDSEEVQKLRDTASELTSLLTAVKDGALANSNLLALAERLCKFAPANLAAAKLRTQIAERAKTAPVDPRLGAPNWSPSPQRTLLGPPIDWLAHVSRPAIATEALSKVLTEHPGQFFTALGLALTGAGQAAIDADLTPRGKEGLFGKLPTLGFGRRGPATCWGLDLSDYSLKAVRVSPGGSDGLQVDAVEYILHRQSPAQAGGEMVRAEILQATLKNFLTRVGDLKGIKLCVGMPGQRVLGRFFELPPMPARKVPDSVQFEARHQLPVALEDLCWSYAILEEQPGKQADQAPRRVLLQAARETHVRDRIGLFKAAGLVVDVVQSDCLALHNALTLELFGEDEAETTSGAIAAIDVGDASTNVVVSSPTRCWFRTFGVAGETFGRELVRQLELTHEQAGQVLRQPARARRYYEWSAAMQPLFVQLGSEVERSLATYAKSNHDQPIRRVYGLGGAFQAHGLLGYLRTGK